MQRLCVFSGASVKAIAAVAYLKTIDTKGQGHIGFVMGKAKLTPLPEHTIPRLELCAAVLATELAELITTEANLEIQKAEFYTDSKVVLGYIHNETRHFYVYVNNRVLRIRRSTRPEQWHFVPADCNPADLATRSVAASRFESTLWFTGPTFLLNVDCNTKDLSTFDLIDADKNQEIRPQVSTAVTTSPNQFKTHCFSRFSTWRSLVRAITCLIHIAQSYKKQRSTHDNCRGWHHCRKVYSATDLELSKNWLISVVQREVFAKEIDCKET